METNNTEGKRRVRRRSDRYVDSVSRPFAIKVRMTARSSARLASIQGLVWRWGKRETMAELFERACLPALEAYVEPYAQAAKLAREAERGIADGMALAAHGGEVRT